MFCNIIKIASLRRTCRYTYSLINANKYLVTTNCHRFYSSRKENDPNRPDDKKVDRPKPTSKSFEKPLTISQPETVPCPPFPPTNRMGPCKFPSGSKLDQLPKPIYPWDEEHEAAHKKYRNHLIFGMIVAAATLAAFWYNVSLTKPAKDERIDRKKRPKPSCQLPKDIRNIPKHVPYILIGGGTASFSAFRTIKSIEPAAQILVISNECHLPYMRPPLSKELWVSEDPENAEKLNFHQWNGTERSIFYEPDGFYIKPNKLQDVKNDKGGVSVLLGFRVVKIDVVAKKVTMGNGKEISYDKCLIATGAKPRNLDLFKSAPAKIQQKVTLYRDIYDFQELDAICKDASAIAIIGGGFLGSELACAIGRKMRRLDKDMKIYQIFKESGNMGKVLPEYLSEWTTGKVKAEGVTILAKTEVEDASLNDDGTLTVHLNNGNQIEVDHVLVAVGVEPNTDLAKTSDLETDPDIGGFLVNAEMEARSNLYVAGDCSCFYDTQLGRRRVEHHDHAVVSGKLAGENMTGASKPYIYQSMFWSDLGPEVGYEAIGIVDSRLPTVGVFVKRSENEIPNTVITAAENSESPKADAEPDKDAKSDDESAVTAPAPPPSNKDEYKKGIVFYLKDNTVVGMVLWNIFNKMDIARQVLKENRNYDDLNEVAKLFKIHDG